MTQQKSAGGTGRVPGASQPKWMKDKKKSKQALRWRLMLGQFSEQGMNLPLGGMSMKQVEETFGNARFLDIEGTLGFLYDREFSFSDEFQLVNQWDKPGSNLGPGGTKGHAILTVPNWLNSIKKLFPKKAVKTLEDDAVKKYGIHEILTDAEMLETIEPDIDLVKTLLSFKNQLNKKTAKLARRIIRQVVRELEDKLLQEVKSAIHGVKNRFQSSPIKIAKNIDMVKTIKRNIKNYDPGSKKLFVDDVFFCSRSFKRKDWHIIICIDQSGSMTDSIIHSAVMGGIFASIKTLETSMVLFDTKVVDVSAHMNDVVDVLFSVQLGGGTNIAKAMKYCQQLVKNPTQTIFIIITDFYEGGSPSGMLEISQQMKEAGITQIGLAALDYNSSPVYDKEIAGRLAEETGMSIGVKTPKELAEFVFNIINSKSR
ncbi:MAG: VWA domain-containing protein [Promethearchaeota archaeon]